jgi:hypothetical protein
LRGRAVAGCPHQQNPFRTRVLPPFCLSRWGLLPRPSLIRALTHLPHPLWLLPLTCYCATIDAAIPHRKECQHTCNVQTRQHTSAHPSAHTPVTLSEHAHTFHTDTSVWHMTAKPSSAAPQDLLDDPTARCPAVLNAHSPNRRRTALHAAAAAGNAAGVALLARQHGIALNAFDAQGTTPLMAAVVSGSAETVR